ncbi:MAG: hypothetical protein U0790_26750 [Isosphaeraceae bacterium]
MARRSWSRPALDHLEPRELLSTLTVTTVVDGLPGSLRDVVGRAQAGDVVRFAPRLSGATLKLTGGEIAISTSLTINGSGQVLDPDQLSRIFRAVGPELTLAISNLTLEDGKPGFDGAFGYVGGAILASDADLKIQNCIFQRNVVEAGNQSLDDTFVAAAAGGAIFVDSGSLTLKKCTFRENSVVGGENTALLQAGRAMGGAILANDSAVSVTGGQFVANAVRGGNSLNEMTEWPSSDGGSGGGGAIYGILSPLQVTGVKFSRNVAIGGKGLDAALSHGDIAAQVGGGGYAGGGAILVNGPGDESSPTPMSIVRSTFHGNRVRGGVAGTPDESLPGAQGGRGQGGAILAYGNTSLVISYSTVDSNSATGGGAGPNTSGWGRNVGWGGVAQGGALYSERGSRVDIIRSQVSNNFAEGGRGSDSPADGTSDAGAGGWAYGGGLYVINGRGGAGVDPYVEPVTLRDCVIQGNTVQGGAMGQGRLNEVHAGGGAQAGGADLAGNLGIDIIRTDWIGNRSIGGTATMSAGGALATPYGADDSHTLIVGGIFRDNQSIGGNDSPNPTYREASAGAFLINSPNTVLVGVTFKNNAAVGGTDTGSGYAGTGKGGAVYIVGQHPSTEFNDCKFTGNAALGGAAGTTGKGGDYNGQGLGGAIFHENGELRVRGGTFSKNLVRGSNLGPGRDAKGGAIYASPIDSPPDYDYVTNTYLAGVLFQANQAVAVGGGVAVGGAIFNGGNILSDMGSRFMGNRASATGGTAYGGAVAHEHETDQTGTPYVPVATFQGTQFNGNLALGQSVPGGPAGLGYGGGIAFLNNPRAKLALISFRRNRASTAGADTWGAYQENGAG